jgi:hypothetical protein
MVFEMKYDLDQLRKDCKMIVQHKGSRAHRGLFTLGEYQDSYISIVDPYIGFPVIRIDNITQVDENEVYTTHGVGEHILSLVVDIEDKIAS